jgi:branched-chain amino acid transport system substrate-binding protein
MISVPQNRLNLPRLAMLTISLTKYLAKIAALAMLFGSFSGADAFAEKKYDPGASDTEIKIGQTYPLSGPASAFAISSRTGLAYYKMLNDKGA